MQKSIFQFVQKHRVSVLAIEMPNGVPHAAALHYSEQQDPLKLFFSTTRSSEKLKAFDGKRTVKGSVVIGFSEEEWLTMQMDGEARIVEED
ncbi:MAG: pyridoxamine 5'-phosphate oxidase family protein, partial [Candidatus Spechtbacterales bacterium]